MKAIFANFGRRGNIDRRDNSFDTASKSPLGAPSRDSPRVHTIYASLDTSASAIGDVPSTTAASSRSKVDISNNRNGDAKQGPANPWAARLAGSLRNGSIRRKPLQSFDFSSAPSEVRSDSSPSKAAPQTPHPPSSYNTSSSQPPEPDATGPALTRKLSTASKRSLPISHATAHQPLSSPSTSQPRRPHLGTNASDSRPRFTSAVVKPQPVAEIDLDRRSTVPLHVDVPSMSSADLATRLDELAVANADGLLTDDEYRTLRQAVFDRMFQSDKQLMSAPTDRDLTGSGLPRHVRSTGAASPASAPARHASSSPDHLTVTRSDSMQGQIERSGSSIRSGRSTTSSSLQHASSFLRRGPNTSKAHGHHSNVATLGEPSGSSEKVRIGPFRRDSESKSSGDSHSQRAMSSHTRRSSGAKSSRISTLGRLRAGSQSRRAHAETAARDLEEALSVERTARSLRAVSLYDTGASGPSEVPKIPRERSPTSLRAEMAPTTMFGVEYADKSSAEIHAEIAVVLGEGNRMLDTFGTLEQALVAKHGALEPQMVREVAERLRETNPLASVHRLETSGELVASRMRRPPPPSSYRQPRPANSTAGALSRDELGESPEAIALETELASIYAQRAAVVKRYQDRLAFLQSKARSAAIREGLK